LLEESLKGLNSCFCLAEFRLNELKRGHRYDHWLYSGHRGNFMLAIMIPFAFGTDPFAAIAMKRYNKRARMPPLVISVPGFVLNVGQLLVELRLIKIDRGKRGQPIRFSRNSMLYFSWTC